MGLRTPEFAQEFESTDFARGHCVRADFRRVIAGKRVLRDAVGPEVVRVSAAIRVSGSDWRSVRGVFLVTAHLAIEVSRIRLWLVERWGGRGQRFARW